MKREHTKNAVIRTILVVAIAASASGQTTECAKVTRCGDEVTMVALSIRVVDSVANTLAQRFGVVVSAEEPQYQFSGDLQDVREADPDWSAQHPKAHYLVPKRRRIEIRFSVLPDGSPSDVGDLLRQILEKVNGQVPFGYRLDVDGEFFSFVPTTTRNADGVVVPAIALLDKRVTIPLGNRRISESAKLMADSLAAQTGLRVSRCQALVAGIPWGMPVAPFEAHDETARSALERLILLNQQSNKVSSRNYWLLRCDSGWCSMNVESVRGGG
jgi:hypothetical protein